MHSVYVQICSFFFFFFSFVIRRFQLDIWLSLYYLADLTFAPQAGIVCLFISLLICTVAWGGSHIIEIVHDLSRLNHSTFFFFFFFFFFGQMLF